MSDEQWIPVESWTFQDSVNRPVEKGGRLINEIRVRSGALVFVKDSDGQEILIRLPDDIRICKRAPLPNAESEPRLIVDEPDDFGIIRIWPFGREPHLASVDVCPHDPFASEQWKGHSIFFRGHLSAIEDTRRYAQALLKACEVAEGMNRQRQESGAQP